MKNQRDDRHRRLILLSCIAALLGAAILLEWNVIRSFLKLRDMRVPYAAFFLALVSLALAVRASRAAWPLWKAFIGGAVVGQLAGTVSLSLANLFIRNGIERNLQALQRDPIGLFLMDGVVALVLGGWLIAGIAFVVYEILSRRYLHSEGP
ncbi:hypothetical protein [Massilia sp. CCM 8734]|uniref:hypothetical protein n=1 Tax=Massilia sp. CCM 8734 TaxID=2609283 RepID=UPI00141E1C37|nr:hypothetical protein [Massilia sp. CCM 8734]NHZ97371.1 hypothetical protein [Massilia sp. CCM 8734]